MALIKPTVDIRWAENSLADGANSTNNKVEPTTAHKDAGFSYPEVPPRNYYNHWMNGVWQWQQYIENWIDSAGLAANNFAQDLDTSTGLTFGYLGGTIQISMGSAATSVVTVAAGTFVLGATTTNHIYIDLSDNTIKKSVSGLPTVAEGTIQLFVISTDGSGITSLNDTRDFTHLVLPATNAEAQTGTDSDKFISAASLAAVVATTTRKGLAEIATQAEVNAGTDTTRFVTPSRLHALDLWMRTDGTKKMTAALNLDDSDLIAYDNGASDLSYLRYNSSTHEFHLVSNSATAAVGNATLNMAKLVTDDIEIPSATHIGAVPSTAAVMMHDSADDSVKAYDVTAMYGQFNTRLSRNYIDGLLLSNGADADHDIDISVGECRDFGNTQDCFSIVGFTKQIDANWTAGDNVGGFPSALTLTNDTGYFVFLIIKPDGTVDFGFDSDDTASNLLTDAVGYTKYRMLGWIYNETATILPFEQDGDDVLLLSKVVVQDANMTTGSRTALDTVSPPNVKANLTLSISSSNSGTTYAVLTRDSQADAAAAASNHDVKAINIFVPTIYYDSTVSSVNMDVKTSSTSQVYLRGNNATNAVVLLNGWTNRRGKE